MEHTDTSPSEGTLTPEERSVAMAQMWDDGSTLQAIGDHFGVTRERARQILKKTGRSGYRPYDAFPQNIAEDARLTRIGEWLQEQGIMTWETFTQETGLTWKQYQLGAIRGLIPRNLVLNRVHCKPPTYTYEDAVAAVTAAYERSEHAVTNKDKTFSGGLYEKWKTPDDPSLVLITMRWRWADIAEAAGVPTERRQLRRTIDLDGMVASVAKYIGESLDAGKKPSGNGYQAWSKGRTDCYSYPSIRLVLRRENMTWQETVLIASGKINH